MKITLAKLALIAALAALWFVGLWHQLSLINAMTYVATSLALAVLVFGFNDRRVFKFAARRRNRGG